MLSTHADWPDNAAFEVVTSPSNAFPLVGLAFILTPFRCKMG